MNPIVPSRKKQPLAHRVLSRVLSWSKKIVGGSLMLIGLSGLPDDLATWSKWIDKAMANPHVIELATRAVEVTEFINQWWMRGLLFALGIFIMFWASRPVWRLRHKLKFRIKNALGNRVWISRETARKIILDSSWASLKKPRVVTSTPLLKNLNLLGGEISEGLSENQKLRLKFEVYISKTLDSFCSLNSGSIRQKEGVTEIDEVDLNTFLSKLLENEVEDDFGPVPKIRVS